MAQLNGTLIYKLGAILQNINRLRDFAPKVYVVINPVYLQQHLVVKMDFNAKNHLILRLIRYAFHFFANYIANTIQNCLRLFHGIGHIAIEAVQYRVNRVRFAQ